MKQNDHRAVCRWRLFNVSHVTKLIPALESTDVWPKPAVTHAQGLFFFCVHVHVLCTAELLTAFLAQHLSANLVGATVLAFAGDCKFFFKFCLRYFLLLCINNIVCCLSLSQPARQSQHR